MSQIQLPERFKRKLEKNQFFEGVIKTTLSQFAEILEDNKLYFFQEYTDHGIKHIESVINSSNHLITNDTFENILSDNDIGYYCLAVILHDIGMHINLDGFVKLIKGDYDLMRIADLDDSTWTELWEDFFNEAKKFSGKQLNAIFGNENFNVRNPPIDTPGEINNYDRMLIGEFIRRHHSRLAHEIALFGFPGRTNLQFAADLNSEIRNLIGLIARSHGINLRICSDQLEKFYGRNNRRIIHGAHAVYLMTLLRNADYIQIEDNRTSKTLLKLKTFSSPISIKEHNTHLTVNYIDLKYQDDPERIYVDASPKDSSIFLKLQKLIKDIQYEFDISWAVLGELYGIMNDKPELKYRRITSNLEDPSFIKKQDYVADSFSYKANDDVIKLLIAPLYGDDPGYGVRELLQNSLDACKEREKLESDANNLFSSNVRIEVVQEDEKFYFVITDTGLGMDVNVIKNYFLSAGASFRKSMDWQKVFVDDQGNSKITRSGRFGVGFLAAFLIGEDILVETKKINSEIGYRFRSHINDEQINILKEKKIEIGTTIKISITKNTVRLLEPDLYNYRSSVRWYDWFTLKLPQIDYIYLGAPIINDNVTDPMLTDVFPDSWNQIYYEGFNKIMWTYDKNFNKFQFTCNGIVIKNHLHGNSLKLGLITKAPKISIFDNNGLLPLTLNRDSFSSQLPFQEEIKRDIYKDFIAFLLTFDFKNPIDKELNFLQNHRLLYPGSENDRYFMPISYGANVYSTDIYSTNLSNQILSILSSKTGFILNYNYFIKQLKEVKAIFIQSENISFEDTIKIDIKKNFLYYSNQRLNSIEDYKSAIEPYSYEDIFIPNNSSNIYMKKNRFDVLFDTNKKRISTYFRDSCNIKHLRENWVNIVVGTHSNSIISEEFLVKNSEKINFIRENTFKCLVDGDPLMDQLLKEYIGDDVIIPYNLLERKKKFVYAFSNLETYMKKYLK